MLRGLSRSGVRGRRRGAAARLQTKCADVASDDEHHGQMLPVVNGFLDDRFGALATCTRNILATVWTASSGDPRAFTRCASGRPRAGGAPYGFSAYKRASCTRAHTAILSRSPRPGTSQHRGHAVRFPCGGIVGGEMVEPEWEHVLGNAAVVENRCPPRSARITRSRCTRTDTTRRPGIEVGGTSASGPGSVRQRHPADTRAGLVGEHRDASAMGCG